MDDWLCNKDENEVYMDSLRCYVTKEEYNFGKNELGVGLNVSRISRTGLLSACTPVLDFVSLKTYIKHGIRKNSMNQCFNYWFPLYLEKETRKNFLHRAKHALSFICNGTTKEFEPSQISKVFYRAISTIILDIVSEKKHPSIIMIRNLIYFHSML